MVTKEESLKKEGVDPSAILHTSRRTRATTKSNKTQSRSKPQVKSKPVKKTTQPSKRPDPSPKAKKVVKSVPAKQASKQRPTRTRRSARLNSDSDTNSEEQDSDNETESEDSDNEKAEDESNDEAEVENSNDEVEEEDPSDEAEEENSNDEAEAENSSDEAEEEESNDEVEEEGSSDEAEEEDNETAAKDANFEAGSDDESDSGKSESEVQSESSAEEEEDDEDEREKRYSTRKRRSTAVTSQAKRNKKSTPAATRTKRKPATVGNRTIHRVNQSMPVLPLRRVVQRDTSELTQYQLAREKLHVSAVPDSLPCREDEFMTIMGYIESAIQEATGTCVYISGVPGTGKTATVLEVIRYLQHQAEEKAIPDFDFVEINGMKLSDPTQAYKVLWECMDRDSNVDGKKKRYTPAHALELLEAKFSNYNRDLKTTIVLMDELDLLVTKKQTVMYNFFDWPSRPFSKLIVVGIANTMDLPERLASNKIASRMGLTRINFQPYKYDQLYKIVQSRLEGIQAFAKEAVEFAARKVSAVSGDARRALDICRRAVEIVESRLEKPVEGKPAPTNVTIAIIDEAIKEMFSTPYVDFVRSCSLHQKIFLISCMQRSRAIGLAELEFGDVAHYHIQTCKWYNIEPPNTSDLMRVCESLGQARAVIMEGGRMDIYMRLSLIVPEEDVIMACKSDRFISRLLQALPNTNP